MTSSSRFIPGSSPIIDVLREADLEDYETFCIRSGLKKVEHLEHASEELLKEELGKKIIIAHLFDFFYIFTHYEIKIGISKGFPDYIKVNSLYKAHKYSFIGMTIFEARRLLGIYKASRKAALDGNETSDATTVNKRGQANEANVKQDKSLGWIPNPQTEMSRFYNKVYMSFYLERVGSFGGGTKKAFKKAFHEESRREYDIEKKMKTIREDLERLKSVKDPSKAGFLLRDNHTLKPHDSTTIKQNILLLNKVETSIDDFEMNMKQHLQKTIHSSGRVLTGHKTAHDFDEQKLSELQGLKRESHGLIASLNNLQETCKAAFKHSYVALKRKSRKRKENAHKSEKRKKARLAARTGEILKKVAPFLPEGKTCEAQDLREDIVKELGQREKKWARSLTSGRCNLLSNDAKSELKTILGLTVSQERMNEGDDECSNVVSDDDTSEDDKGSVSEGDSDAEDDGASQGEPSGCDVSGSHSLKKYDSSSSSDDAGPYWNTFNCTPYFYPISDTDSD